MLKVLTILLTFILLSSFQFAQEKNILRPDGKIIKHSGDLKNLEVQSIKEGKSGNLVPIGSSRVPNSILGGSAIDTLEYWSQFVAPLSNFGMFGQDWMLQWFKAPVGLNIRQVAFACYENVDNMTVEVKVIKANWTEEELANAGITLWGYYEATGNGFNDITSLLDNPDRTGGWTAVAPGSTEPFGIDLWSDGGVGFPIVAVGDVGVTHAYQWIDLSVIGYPPIAAGEIFAIAIRHTGTTYNANRVGFWTDDLINGFTAWKFYANGRTNGDLGTAGWWSREFTFDFVAEVEYTEDVPPSINSFTQLPGTIDLGPFTVDANITDLNAIGTAGVASAYLHWSADGGTTWDSVAMAGTEPDFTGQIPAQSAFLITVEYFISATDVNGNYTSGPSATFYIFAPTPNVTTLVVFNGYNDIIGYPQDYYFGPDIQGGTAEFEHDVWAYGPLPAGVLDTYTDVLEICNGAPADYNDDVIRPWIAADGSHNYYLEGQEWLGSRYSYVDMPFVAGSFEFDILGINYVFNDVSYDGTSGQLIQSLVWPEAGSLFGQPLLTLFNSYIPLPDSLMYNPTFEANVGDLNWIDGYDVEGDVLVDMRVETRGIAYAPAVDTLITASHRTLTAGNKIFYAAYWTNSLNTAVSNAYPYYNWIGYTNENSPYQALVWFGVPIITVDVKETGGNIPQEFAISQNYPNPFNPSTKISFAVPYSSFVTLKVYDILGKEVKTLVNEEMKNGNYELTFDAAALASGMYIYTLTAGNFTSSKKMVLLK